jgi:hypothetical protein
LKVVGKLRRDRPSNLLKDNVGKLFLEGWQEASQVCTQVDEFHGGTLDHSQESSKKKQAVGILQGESTTSREPLDLVEVQER